MFVYRLTGQFKKEVKKEEVRSYYALPLRGMGPSWPSIEHGHVGITAHPQTARSGIKLTTYRTLSEHSTTMITPVESSQIATINLRKIFQIDHSLNIRPQLFEELVQENKSKNIYLIKVYNNL